MYVCVYRNLLFVLYVCIAETDPGSFNNSVAEQQVWTLFLSNIWFSDLVMHEIVFRFSRVIICHMLVLVRETCNHM